MAFPKPTKSKRLLETSTLAILPLLSAAQSPSSSASYLPGDACVTASSMCDSGDPSATSSACSDFCNHCIWSVWQGCCTETAQPALRDCISASYEAATGAPERTVTTTPGGVTFVYTATDYGPGGGEGPPDYVESGRDIGPELEMYSSCGAYGAVLGSCSDAYGTLSEAGNNGVWNANWINCACYAGEEEGKSWLPARFDDIWSPCQQWYAEYASESGLPLTGTYSMTAPCRDAGDIRAMGITEGTEEWTSTVSQTAGEGEETGASSETTASEGSTGSAGPAETGAGAEETGTGSADRMEVGIMMLVTAFVTVWASV